ncbi:hypothetical protein SRHO_G00332960 [Serrasalmus rhombeus]
MELSSLSVTLLLIVLIHCGQTQDKPRLRVDPQSSVYTGDTVTLTCEPPYPNTGWRFYWKKDSQYIDHQYESTFSITESHPGETEFRCIAVRGRYLSEESDPIRITVRERPQATVNVQPAGHVFIRERVTLTCGIESGDDWNYEWYKNNNLLRDAQRKKYEISNVDQTHAGDYTCKGTQSTGRIYTHTSAAVTLTVSERPNATVNVQPAGHVFIRERVTLTCGIESGDDWNYEWYKNNNLLRDAQRKKYEISNVDQTHADKPRLRVDPQSSVYTGDTVTLSCETPSQSDWSFFWKKDSQDLPHQLNTISITVSSPGEEEYRCAVSRGVYNTQDSDPIRITVRERPTATVNVQPAGHVFIRERVTLTCGIESGDDWNYEWYKNNNLLRDAQRKKYEISNVDQTHAVKVKPTITSNPEGAALTGDTVTLYCKLHQSAGWTFYWSKHTQSSEKETITNVYTISSVRLSDGGQYWCRAGRGNPVYYTHYSDALWVNVTASGPRSGSTVVIVGVSVGLSLILLLIIILGLICCYKKSKGDSAAQPSDDTYAQIVTKKNRRGNDEGATQTNDVTYSQIQLKNLEHHEKGL